MKREIRDKWVAALRSGRYKQAVNYLRVTRRGSTCHCALGVLAEELGLFDGPGEREATINGSPNFLPESIIPEPSQRAVSLLNDYCAMTFPELANFIESQIPCEE